MRGWHCVQLHGGKNGWTKKLLQPSSEREKQHRPRGGSGEEVQDAVRREYGKLEVLGLIMGLEEVHGKGTRTYG